MKTWMKYSEYLKNGEWHIHTSYSDGKNTVHDYCMKASELDIPLIAFTEHVRRKLDYDFSQYLEDIDKAREEFDLIILSGCEAKILPDGSLDVEEEILKQVDYPIFAFHSFPMDLAQYIESLKSVLINPYINTWAHPGLFLRKHGLDLSDQDLCEIFRLLKTNNVLLEINRRYNVPDKKWITMAVTERVQFVQGGDCHCIKELEDTQK